MFRLQRINLMNDSAICDEVIALLHEQRLGGARGGRRAAGRRGRAERGAGYATAVII